MSLYFRRFFLLLAPLALLLGCQAGGGGGTGTGAVDPGGSADTRAGETYDVMLASELDGENIAFTVHEPNELSAGQAYPLILHSHGYSGSRQASRPTEGHLARLLENGYGILSLDERGNGESGGTVRILDPNFEGQDWLQVLDWSEENLPWMAYRDGNPVMGATGGSYGGGYQLMIYAIDPQHRLDAIVPDITWHDLRYSLYSGEVFKTTWATLLSAAGTAPPNTQDQIIQEGLAEGLATNNLSQDKLGLLYQNSLRSHCEGANAVTAAGGLTPIDALITQSHLDTLFNFNDAYGNFRCLSEQGGDVRLLTKAAGHGIDSGDGGSNCGRIDRGDAELAWFDEKLKGLSNAASFVPRICLNLGNEGDDAVVLNAITVGGSAQTPIDQQTLTLSAASLDVLSVPLYTAPAGGMVLAGIPTVDMTVLDAVLGEAGVLDPILFAAIGYAPAGSSSFTALQNQVAPVRGYGQHQQDLIGVMQRLNEGDQLALMLHPSHAEQYATSSSKVPVTVMVDATVSLPLLPPNLPAP